MGKATNWIRFQEPPVISDKAKWYCVFTNPNCQRRAELELYALGYRTFAPKIRKWVSHARVRKAVERPLLGRYLFVEIDHVRQSFGLVRTVNGVEGFVSNLGEPVSIPSHYIDDFRLRYMRGEWDFVRSDPVTFVNSLGEIETRYNPKMPIGARITIVEGEFNDMLATVTQRKRGKLHFKLLDENRYGELAEYAVRAA